MTRHESLLAKWVFPPSDTWLSFIACATFEAILLFLCYHPRGPELAKRGPSILGRWLKPKANGDGAGPAPVKINPPSSVAQSWRLGALHERFFRGARAGEQSTLREAGAVLGAGRPLTEEEFVSLARASEQATHRSRCCGSLSDCLFLAGVSGAIITIGPALYYITTPIHEPLAKTITATVNIMRATPMCLVCLSTLIISMAFVCDGFRAPDKGIGGRIALTGVAGAIASMYYSTMLDYWGGLYATYVEEWVVILGFSAAALAPIAVKFEFSLGGFLAVVSTFYCAACILNLNSWLNAYMVGAMTVDGLFALAVCLRFKTRTLQPFCSGVMATGVFLLHGTLFFNSFWDDEMLGEFEYWHTLTKHAWRYMAVQLLVFLGLLASWCLGKSIGCDGLVNNARLFGALYVFATIVGVSYHLPGDGGQYLGWAVVFLGVWRVGLYLHGHRDFASSLWTLDASQLSRRGCGLGSNGGDSDKYGGFERPGAELLLDEEPVFEPEMGMPRLHVAKQPSSSSASSHLFRSSSGGASYGVPS